MAIPLEADPQPSQGPSEGIGQYPSRQRTASNEGHLLLAQRASALLPLVRLCRAARGWPDLRDMPTLSFAQLRHVSKRLDVDSLLPQSTNANQPGRLELHFVDVREREFAPELVPERGIESVENERQQISMSCDNHVLPSMTLDELMHRTQPASLSHRVGFTVTRRVCGEAPRFPDDSFEITRRYHRQVPFPKFSHDVDANAKTLSEQLHRLDRSSCRTGIDRGHRNCR